jgi:hypothetical protein
MTLKELSKLILDKEMVMWMTDHWYIRIPIKPYHLGPPTEEEIESTLLDLPTRKKFDVNLYHSEKAPQEDS